MNSRDSARIGPDGDFSHAAVTCNFVKLPSATRQDNLEVVKEGQIWPPKLRVRKWQGKALPRVAAGLSDLFLAVHIRHQPELFKGSGRHRFEPDTLPDARGGRVAVTFLLLR